MNSKIRSLLFATILAPMLLLLSTKEIFAAPSIGLQPATGNIATGGTTVNLTFNSDGETVAGMSVKFTLSSNLEYVSSSSSVCDQSFDVQEGTGTLVVSCLFTDSQTFSGNVASFVFKASSSSGTGTIVLSNADPDTSSLSNGSYTLTTATSTDDSDLPDAGIPSIFSLIIGMVFLGLGYLFFFQNSRREKLLMESIEEEKNLPPMKGKI